VSVIVTFTALVVVNLKKSSSLLLMLPAMVTGRVTVCAWPGVLFGSVSATFPPPPPVPQPIGLLRVPVKVDVPEQVSPGALQVQVLLPLKLLQVGATVAVSEVMVVVPPASG
jgi:hypothetical protein